MSIYSQIAKGWIFAGLRKISFSLKLHLVKELPSFCKLQNNEQEVRCVNHILKQWYVSAWGEEGVGSKLEIPPSWWYRGGWQTGGFELRSKPTLSCKDSQLTIWRKKDSRFKIYLIPPLNVVAVVFLQIILIATLIGRFQLQNLPQKNTFSDQPRDQKYLCRSGILKPSLTSPQAPLPRFLLT